MRTPAMTTYSRGSAVINLVDYSEDHLAQLKLCILVLTIALEDFYRLKALD